MTFVHGIVTFFKSTAEIWGKYSSFFWQGAVATLVISIFAVLLGTVFGMLIAMLRLSKVGFLRGISRVYTEIIRGTPALLQIMLCYALLSKILPIPDIQIGGLDLSRVIPGIIALSMNSGAYVSEIIRSGISAVNIGQTEAAYSLGLRSGQTMWYVVLPQAVRNILPALGNEFITIIKESSVLSVIGIAELMFKTGNVRSASFSPIEPYIIAAIFYFVMTFSVSLIISFVEKRMSKGVRK